jgi:hypothetical protein
LAAPGGENRLRSKRPTGSDVKRVLRRTSLGFMTDDAGEMAGVEASECRIEQGAFVFLNGHFKIPLDGCASHEGVLRLTDETWVTRRTLGQFLSLAMETERSGRKPRK